MPKRSPRKKVNKPLFFTYTKRIFSLGFLIYKKYFKIKKGDKKIKTAENYFRLRRFKKLTRKYWKPAIAILLISAIIINIFFPNGTPNNINTAQASTNVFNQTNWNGGATSTTIVDPTNKSSWNYYNYASSSIDFSTAGQISIASTSTSTLQTLTSQFSTGTTSTTTISSTNNNVVLATTSQAYTYTMIQTNNSATTPTAPGSLTGGFNNSGNVQTDVTVNPSGTGGANADVRLIWRQDCTHYTYYPVYNCDLDSCPGGRSPGSCEQDGGNWGDWCGYNSCDSWSAYHWSSPGTYTSYFDSGQATPTWGTFQMTKGSADYNAGQIDIKIKVSNSNASVPTFDATGADCVFSVTADGALPSAKNLANCANLGTGQYLWYEATLSSSFWLVTLNDVTVTAAIPIVVYSPSGTFTSNQIDTGQLNASSVISWNASTTPGISTTTMQVIGATSTASLAGKTWCNITSGQNMLSVCASNQVASSSRYFQYKATLSTSDNTQTPSLNDVTITSNYYPTSTQSLISSPYDTTKLGNVITGLSWTENTVLPTSTSVAISIRTASTSALLASSGWTDFTDATANCTKSGATTTCNMLSILTGLKDGLSDQWFQYKITLGTSDGIFTPTVYDVNINYDSIDQPLASTLYQYRADGVTQIATSSPSLFASTTTLVLGVQTSANQGISTSSLRAQFEFIATSSGAFTNTVMATGSIVAYPYGGMSTSSINVVNGTAYKWQARLIDATTNTIVSPWTSFNANNTAFIIDTTAPPVPVTLNRGLSGDNQYASTTGQLACNWSTATDTLSGLARYEIAYGTSTNPIAIKNWTSVGTSTATTTPGLTLVSGTIYSCFIRTFDNAGIMSTSTATSSNILYDNTVPSPATVYTGLTPGSNDAYASTTATLKSNWTAVVDSASGLARYDYAIGTSSGASGVLNWTPIASTTISTTTIGLVLAVGQNYYFSVRAIDNAGNVSATTTSPAVMYDNTVPATPSPVSANSGNAYSSSISTIYSSWATATDTGSGVNRYEIAIGTSTNPTLAFGWTSVGSTTATTTTGLNLQGGINYFVYVRVFDNAGNVGPVATSSTSFQVDPIPPPAPAMAIANGGLTYLNSTTTLSSAWATSTDLESGLNRYEISIGTLAAPTSTKNWTSVGTAVSTTTTGLALSEGTNYYVFVRAFDNANNQSTSTATSSAVIPDVSAPTSPAPLVTNNYSTTTNILSVSWNSSTDSGSGLNRYEVAIGTSSSATNIMNWTPVASTSNATTTGWITLVSGIDYYYSVKAIDNVNNTSVVATSTAIRYDNTPPTGTILVNANASYASSSTVNLNLAMSDVGFGVAQMQFSNDNIYWSGWEATSTSRSGWNLAGAQGTSTVYARFIDLAGNISSTTISDDIILDTIAPILSPITITSNNGSSTLAKAGNLITVSFVSSEPLSLAPTSTIAGRVATVTNTNGLNYTATVNMQAGDSEGNIHFILNNYYDLAGIPGSPMSTTSDNSLVTFDKTAPNGYSVASILNYFNLANQDSVSFSFSGAEPGATYDYAFSDPGAIHTVTGTGAIVSGNDSVSGINISALSDGTITLSAHLTDPAGNVGSSTSFSKTKDTVRPTLLSFTSDTASNTAETAYGTGKQISIKAVYSEPLKAGSNMIVILDNAGSFTVTLSAVSGNTISGTTTVVGPNLGFDADPLDIRSIQSEAVTDIANNTQSGLSMVIQADNLAATNPIYVSTAPPAIQSFTASTTGAFKAGQIVTLYANYSKKIKSDGSGYVTVKVNNNNGSEGTNTITLNTVDPLNFSLYGNYVVQAGDSAATLQVTSVTDQSVSSLNGNTATSTGPIADFNPAVINLATSTNKVQIDTALPQLGLLPLTIDSGATLASSTNVLLTLSGSDNFDLASTSISMNGSTWCPSLIYTIFTGWDFSNPVCGGNTDNGEKTIYVKFLDRAGNESEVATSSIIYDSIAPILDTITATTPTGLYGPGTVIPITATYAEDLSPVGTNTLVVLLNDGASVTLSSTTANTISGNYTVGNTGSGQSTVDLTVASIVTQSVYDIVRNHQATTSLAGLTENIGTNKDIAIDTAAPIGVAPTVDRSLSSGQITASATDANPAGMQMEVVVIATSSDPCDFTSATPIAYATTTDLVNNDTYPNAVKVCVKYIDTVGNESASLTTITPDSPLSLQAYDVSNPDAGAYRLFLSWTLPQVEGTDGFDRYEISRCYDAVSNPDCVPASPYFTIPDKVQNFFSDSCPANDCVTPPQGPPGSNIATSTRYCYQLREKDKHGNYSKWSDVQCAVPGAGASSITKEVSVRFYPTADENVPPSSVFTTEATIRWQTVNKNDPSEPVLANSKVWWRMASTSEWTKNSFVASYMANHAFVISGLDPGTTYEYKVESATEWGSTDALPGDNPQTFTTKVGPVITNVKETHDANSANITWDTSDSATGLPTLASSLVYYSDTLNSEGQLNSPMTGTCDGGNVTAHACALSNLTSNTTYYYYVYSVLKDDPEGFAADSQGGRYYNFKTTVDIISPIITPDLNPIILTDTQAAISWNTNEPAKSWLIYGTVSNPGYILPTHNFQATSPTDNPYSNFLAKASTTATNFVMELNSLSASSTYFYRLVSEDPSGNTSVSGEYSFGTLMTQVGHPDLTDPGDPQVLQLSDTEVTVWLSTLNTDAYSKLCYSTSTIQAGDMDTCPNTDSILTSTRFHVYHLSGLDVLNTYHVRIRTTDPASSTLEFLSNDVPFVTRARQVSHQDLVNPGNPHAVQISDTEAVVTLNTNTSATSKLCYATTTIPDIGFCSDFLTIATGTTNHVYHLTGLVPDTTYHIRIRTTDSAIPLLFYDSADNVTFITKTKQVGHSTLTQPDTPVVAEKTDVSAVVMLTTNTQATSTICYGTSVIQNSDLDNGTCQNYQSISLGTTNHVYTLAGLVPQTAYNAIIKTTDALDPNISFYASTTFTTLEKLSTETEVKAREDAAKAAAQAAQQQPAGGGVLIIDKADKNAPNISNISVTDIKADTATINWKTDKSSNGFVEHGLTSSYGRTLGNYDSTLMHNVLLDSLEPSTVYHFSVLSGDSSGNLSRSSDQTFTTLSLEEQIKQATTTPADQQSNDNLIIAAARKAIDMVKMLASSVSLNALETTANAFDSLTNFLPPPIMSGSPTIDVTSNSVTVSWQTDKETNSLVAIASADNFNIQNTDPYAQVIGLPNDKTIKHKVTVLSLKPDTTYHYQLRSKAPLGPQARSNDFTFTTKKEQLEIIDYSAKNINSGSVMFSWTTNNDTDSAVEYIPYRNNILAIDEKKIKEDKTFTSIHEITIPDLAPGMVYQVKLLGQDTKGDTVERVIETYSTGEDKTPPQIAQVQTDQALSTGKELKVQTVISWDTDEPATSRVYFQKGFVASSSDMSEKSALDLNYTKKHGIVITKFEPGAIYTFRVESTDSSGNPALSKLFTVLTPRQKESVFQIILKNFESIFGWMNNVGG